MNNSRREAGWMTTNSVWGVEGKGVVVVEGGGKEGRQGVVERRPR